MLAADVMAEPFMDQSRDSARLNVTKLFWPPAPEDFVPRHHLQERLDEIGRRPLTLLSAPAGYGKSTTISAWLQSSGCYRAWLSLDESDNATATFLTYFLAAIRKPIPGFADELVATVAGSSVPPNSQFIATLAAELELLDRAVVLVLDDFQLINNAEILALFTEWMRHPHPGLHLVLLTRHDPDLPLESWRARNQVTDIRSNSLRFSTEESAEFLRKATNGELGGGDVARLQAVTEGWAAALRLAVLSLGQGTGRGEGVLDVEAIDFELMAYLAGQVLDRTSADTQQFLLKTSFLERLSGPLCDAVLTGTPLQKDGQAILNELYQENMFLVPISSDRQWFRYHHLFQEFLQRRFASSSSPESLATLHHLAARWFAENGDTMEAIRHYIAADDMKAAIQVVAENRGGLMAEDRWLDLETWFRLFPASVVDTSPDLLLIQAWSAQFRRFDLPFLAQISGEVDTLLADSDLDPGRVEQLAAENEILKAAVAYFGAKPDVAVAASERGLAVLSSSHYMARSYGWLYASGARQMQGDLSGAQDAIDQARLEDLAQTGYPKARASAAKGYVAWMNADLSGVKQAGEAMLIVGTASSQPQTFNWGHYFLASAHYHQNALDKAIHHARFVLEHRIGSHVHGAMHTGMVLALSYLGQGEQQKVDDLMEELAAFAVWARSESMLALLEGMKADIAYRRGQANEAMYWAELAMTRLPLAAMPIFYVPHLTVAKVLVAANGLTRRSLVSDYLARLHEHAERINNTRVFMEVLALEALFLDSLGREEAACELLERSLHLAEPSGFVRLYIDLGAQMRGLLARFAQRNPSTELVNRIRLDASEAISVSEPSNDALIESLTNRECQVLELLARRLSNQEIGDELVITVSTVKRHTINIYQKLGVRSRRDAVSAARALGILDG